MNKKLTEKLLSEYRATDGSIKLQHFMPLDWNGRKWCSATDGHQFILIPENYENKLEMPPIETVNIAAIMPVFNLSQSIKNESLKNAFDKIPIIDSEITEECPACDGEGEFDHYGDTYICQRCDQTGLVGTGRFEKVKHPDYVIKVGSAIFKGDFINKLVNVYKLTEAKNILIVFQEKEGLTVFELDNKIIVGIMSKTKVANKEELIEVAD
jgi:hypothetical protein